MNSDAPPTLQGDIRRLLATGMTDPEDVATAVVAGLSEHERLRWLTKLVKTEVRAVKRYETRRKEASVRTDIANGADSVESRRQLMNEMFVLPDGRWVRWLEATAQDHLERAGWLQRIEHGLRATREQHEAAAKLITDAGVTCLGDLDPEYVALNTGVTA